MGEREIDVAEYVAACEAKGCCPLGAALGEPITPSPLSDRVLDMTTYAKAQEIARFWDGKAIGSRKDRPESVRLALAAGLGPAMRRFLFGEEASGG